MAGTLASIAASIYVLELVPPAALVATTVGSFAPNDLAQRAWHAYVDSFRSASFIWFLVKVPTWAALDWMLAASLALCARSRLPVLP